MDRLSSLKKSSGTQPPTIPSKPSADLEKGIGKDGNEGEKSANNVAAVGAFYQDTEAVKKMINEFDGHTTEIAQLHAMALRSVDLVESKQIMSGIETKTSETNNLGKEITAKLKEMTENTQTAASKLDSEGSKAQANATRLRTNLLNGLSTKFASKIKAFQALQISSKQQYSDQLRRQFSIVKPNATPTELAAISSEGGGAILSQQLFEGASKADAKKVLEKMLDRQRSIDKLEKSLLALHQLFLDMQMLIGMQGKVIDSIEESVITTEGYVEEAASEMQKAVTYQKAAWKKRVFFFLLAFGLVILILIFYVIPFVRVLIGK